MKILKVQYIGLITGLTMIAASLFSFYILKFPVESNFQLVIYGLLNIGILFNLFSHFKSNAANKSFKDYFGIGFKTFVVTALLMAVFTYVFFSINTSFRDDKIAENSRLLLQEGNHMPNEISDNTKQLKKLFMPIMISLAVFRSLIFGAIFTIIISLFATTKGRSSRKTYWGFLIVSTILNSIILVIVSNFSLPISIVVILNVIFQTYTIILGIKRMHDINKSGLFYFIPFYNLFLALRRGSIGKNQYGNNP